jgi:hypothetical protein
VLPRLFGRAVSSAPISILSLPVDDADTFLPHASPAAAAWDLGEVREVEVRLEAILAMVRAAEASRPPKDPLDEALEHFFRARNTRQRLYAEAISR